MRTETMSISDFMAGNYGTKKNREKVKKIIKKHAPVTMRVAIIVGSAIVFNSLISIPVSADFGGSVPANTAPAPNDALTVNPDGAVGNFIDGEVYTRILKAFEPVIFLVKAISYPIATLVALGGGLLIMIGSREKGFGLIQQAGIGYIIVQMIPLLMKLLVEIAKSI